MIDGAIASLLNIITSMESSLRMRLSTLSRALRALPSYPLVPPLIVGLLVSTIPTTIFFYLSSKSEKRQLDEVISLGKSIFLSQTLPIIVDSRLSPEDRAHILKTLGRNGVAGGTLFAELSTKLIHEGVSARAIEEAIMEVLDDGIGPFLVQAGADVAKSQDSLARDRRESLDETRIWKRIFRRYWRESEEISDRVLDELNDTRFLLRRVGMPDLKFSESLPSRTNLYVLAFLLGGDESQIQIRSASSIDSATELFGHINDVRKILGSERGDSGLDYNPSLLEIRKFLCSQIPQDMMSSNPDDLSVFRQEMIDIIQIPFIQNSRFRTERSYESITESLHTRLACEP